MNKYNFLKNNTWCVQGYVLVLLVNFNMLASKPLRLNG